MWEELGHALGIQPLQAAEVAIGAFAIYLAILFLIRLLGQRTVATLSSIDTAAVIVLGAIGGRAVLGRTPTVVAGVIALVALFCVRILVAQLRRYGPGMRILGNRPVLLMIDGRLIDDNLARAHMLPSEVYAKLRTAGIRRHDEVACAILESTGTISVLRHGSTIDPEFLEAVVGREEIPAVLVSDPD